MGLILHVNHAMTNMIIIDCVALAKQGDNALGSVRPSVQILLRYGLVPLL